MKSIERVLRKYHVEVSSSLKKVLLVVVLIFSVTSVMASNELSEKNKADFFNVIDDFQTQSKSSSTYQTDKMNALSHVLLGVVYVGGSVGEGEGGRYDKDPLVRFDEFDCTTYVETILAGMMSATSDEFESRLMRLRYKDGHVSFVSRNHFPSLDWLPNNQDKLVDITAIVAGDAVLEAKTIIDKAAWYQHLKDNVIHCDSATSEDCQSLLAQLQAEGQAFQPESASLLYVPFTHLFHGENREVNHALLERIPSGSVINMVRPDWALKKWIGTNMNVSHQGIAIRKNDTLYLRHASVVHKKVLDENFADYFARFSSASSLKGFNVQMLKPE